MAMAFCSKRTENSNAKTLTKARNGQNFSWGDYWQSMKVVYLSWTLHQKIQERLGGLVWGGVSDYSYQLTLVFSFFLNC